MKCPTLHFRLLNFAWNERCEGVMIFVSGIRRIMHLARNRFEALPLNVSLRKPRAIVASELCGVTRGHLVGA